jgi:hypothetical protein
MKVQYRTFINKDCDKTVFGPLFDRNPYHLRVGTSGHAFFTDTLREMVGDLTIVYDNISLFQYDEWTGQELYEYISTEIGEKNYMGAIETTEAQSGLMVAYFATISQPIEP